MRNPRARCQAGKAYRAWSRSKMCLERLQTRISEIVACRLSHFEVHVLFLVQDRFLSRATGIAPTIRLSYHPILSASSPLRKPLPRTLRFRTIKHLAQFCHMLALIAARVYSTRPEGPLVQAHANPGTLESRRTYDDLPVRADQWQPRTVAIEVLLEERQHAL